MSPTKKRPQDQLWNPPSKVPTNCYGSYLTKITPPSRAHLPVPPMPQPTGQLTTFRKSRPPPSPASAAASALTAPSAPTTPPAPTTGSTAEAAGLPTAPARPPPTLTESQKRVAFWVEQQALQQQHLKDMDNTTKTQQAMAAAAALAAVDHHHMQKLLHRQALEALDRDGQRRQQSQVELVAALHIRKLFQENYPLRFTKYWRTPTQNSWPFIQSRDPPPNTDKKDYFADDITVSPGEDFTGLLANSNLGTYDVVLGHKVSIAFNYRLKVDDFMMLTMTSADSTTRNRLPQVCQPGSAHGIGHPHHIRTEKHLFDIVHGAGQNTYNVIDKDGARHKLLQMTHEAVDTITVVFNCSGLAALPNSNGNMFLRIVTNLSHHQSAFTIPFRVNNPSTLPNLSHLHTIVNVDNQRYHAVLDLTEQPVDRLTAKEEQAKQYALRRAFTYNSFRDTTMSYNTLRSEVTAKIRTLSVDRLRHLHRQLCGPSPPPPPPPRAPRPLTPPSAPFPSAARSPKIPSPLLMAARKLRPLLPAAPAVAGSSGPPPTPVATKPPPTYEETIQNWKNRKWDAPMSTSVPPYPALRAALDSPDGRSTLPTPVLPTPVPPQPTSFATSN